MFERVMKVALTLSLVVLVGIIATLDMSGTHRWPVHYKTALPQTVNVQELESEGSLDLMGAFKRAMLAAEESQPWDATEYLRDELVINADAYEEAQLLIRGVPMRDELRFAIGTWHRLAGLAMKAEAQGSSNEVKNVIHRAIAVCENQIQRLGGKIPTL
jgi:hypothetical protein